MLTTEIFLFFQDCAKNLLRHVTHEEFKGTIMPYMQKMMLRNPEIIIDSRYLLYLSAHLKKNTIVYFEKSTFVQ
jgi:hypothetical protein